MENVALSKTKVKVSLIINILVVVATIFASVVMFTGFKFMHGYEPVLESTKLGMLRFFTVQSNLFVGVVSLIFAIKEIQLLRGKIENISKRMYLLKLMSTTSVGVTFFVVFLYLGPIAVNGIPSLLRNSNLFFHLLIPVVSIFNFIFFERSDKISFKNTLFGLVPTVIYEVYYLGNILAHMENGKVSPIYDWYWFVQNGVWTAIIVAPMMMLVTYLICIIIWRANRSK